MRCSSQVSVIITAGILLIGVGIPGFGYAQQSSGGEHESEGQLVLFGAEVALGRVTRVTEGGGSFGSHGHGDWATGIAAHLSVELGRHRLSPQLALVSCAKLSTGASGELFEFADIWIPTAIGIELILWPRNQNRGWRFVPAATLQYGATAWVHGDINLVNPSTGFTYGTSVGIMFPGWERRQLVIGLRHSRLGRESTRRTDGWFDTVISQSQLTIGLAVPLAP